MAEQQERADAEQRGNADDDLGRRLVHAHRGFQERQAAEHRRVPDHGEPGGNAEQRDEQPLLVARRGQAFHERIAGQLVFRLHRLEHRAFRQLEPHPQRNREQSQAEDERHAPAPRRPELCPQQRLAGEHHDQAEHEAADHAGLDEAGEETAPLRRQCSAT
jgi:hypothetical protein